MRVTTILLLCTMPALGADLKVGAAAVVITPPKGTPLAGYYSQRGATAVLDDLYSKAIVLQVGDRKAALVVCDLISLPRHVVLEARRLSEEATGIPGSHIMISATHTHTGPALIRESATDDLLGAHTDLGRRYSEQLPSLIARSIAAAHKSLQPARVGAAVGKEETISFNRRFVMKDGSVSWNPPKRHPGIVRPAGPIDPDVAVAWFESDRNAPLAAYVNFALHPDTIGGTDISADYPGVLARLLADARSKDLVTVFANGCCGNINHRDVHWLDPQRGPGEAHRIGTILAAATLKTLRNLEPVRADHLRCRSALVKLPLAAISDEDLQQARETIKKLNDPKTPFLDKVKAYQVLDVAAHKSQALDVEVQAICLGRDLAWVSLPGEIFVELGLAIKNDSPFRTTMIAELANGSIGYIPDRPAYEQGNYEVVSARCGPGSGELLVDAARRLLRELAEPDR